MDEGLFRRAIGTTRQAFLSPHQPQWNETPEESRARNYRDLPERGRDDYLRSLIAESAGDKLAWDSVKLIAETLLRDAKQLPDDLAEWVADVLTDIAKPRKDRRRPRPTRGDRPRQTVTGSSAVPSSTWAPCTTCRRPETAKVRGNAAQKADPLAMLSAGRSSGRRSKRTRTRSGFGESATRSCPTRRAKKARTTRAGFLGILRAD